MTNGPNPLVVSSVTGECGRWVEFMSLLIEIEFFFGALPRAAVEGLWRAGGFSLARWTLFSAAHSPICARDSSWRIPRCEN